MQSPAHSTPPLCVPVLSSLSDSVTSSFCLGGAAGGGYAQVIPMEEVFWYLFWYCAYQSLINWVADRSEDPYSSPHGWEKYSHRGQPNPHCIWSRYWMCVFLLYIITSCHFLLSLFVLPLFYLNLHLHFSSTFIWLVTFMPSLQPITWWQQLLMPGCCMRRPSQTRWPYDEFTTLWTVQLLNFKLAFPFYEICEMCYWMFNLLYGILNKIF